MTRGCSRTLKTPNSPPLAVSVGHRREMGGTILPIVHDKCGSSSIANTTDAEPFDQVARLAVGGSPHAASAVTLLFFREVDSFRGRGQCGPDGRSLVVRDMYRRQEGQRFRLELRDAPNPCRAPRRMHNFAVSTRSASHSSGEMTACARS